MVKNISLFSSPGKAVLREFNTLSGSLKSVLGRDCERNVFITETESSGSAALDKIEKHDYAVVFTDLIMPEISGLDLLKAVKKSGALTEVIIVTGYGTIESAISLHWSGVRRIPNSPIHAVHLLKHPTSLRTGVSIHA